MANPKKATAPAKAASPTETPAAESPPVETPTVETPPAPTPEEIEAQAAELQAQIFGPVSSGVNARLQEEREAQAEQEPEPEVADEPETPEVEEVARTEDGGLSEEPAKTEADPEPEPAPAPAIKERFVPGAAMTPEAVEETARRAAREELEERAAAEPEPEPPKGGTTYLDETEGLSDAEQDHFIVLKKMAAINPAHRDLPNRQKEFWKKDANHRAKWEQANPGAVFDPEAPEHAEFYRKNEPFIPRKDFKAAERAIIVDEAEERAVSRLRKEQEPRIREIELKEREREAEPLIYTSMADAAEEVFSAAPQFKESFEPKKLTAAAIQKMEEINPVLAQVAQEEADRAAVMVRELEKLERFGGHYAVDYSKRHQMKNGQVILPHVELEQAYGEAEAELLKKSERNGKKLISVAERDARFNRILQNKALTPEQQERAVSNVVNSFDWARPADTRNHIIAKSKARVGQFAERFTKMAQPAGKNTTANGVPAAAAENPPKPAVTPPKPSGKANLARGTATASSSDVSDNSPKGRSEAEKSQEYLVKAAFP